MSDLSWAATVRLVHERAHYCCEYCQTCQDVIGQPMHVEHIDPDGGDNPDNLCLSCASCNLSKSVATAAVDPDTGKTVNLFNPRTQVWIEHFLWLDDGQIVQGLTPNGRATVIRMRMNLDRIVLARRVWIRGGAHPPRGGKE